MRLLDVTTTSRDEEFNVEVRVSRMIEEELRRLVLDTYNEEYVIRITVDKVDHHSEKQDDDDEG